MSSSRGQVKLWSPRIVEQPAEKSEAVLYVLKWNNLQDVLSCEKARIRIERIPFDLIFFLKRDLCAISLHVHTVLLE